MRLATFHGGVHPLEGKELTEKKPIRTIMPKGELVFPLSQHIGAPAKALVKKGDQVLRGQLIAEAGGFVSANIISSVSGKVKAVEPRLVVSGAKVPAIVIENDGLYTEVDGIGKVRDAAAMSKQDIIAAVKEAGIVGLGGAGFPTHVKLMPKDPNAIDYIIVNGAECEPYLTSDHRQMLENGEEIVKGLEVVLRLFDNAKGVIAIEANKPDAISTMQRLVGGHARISVVPLKTKYPQGGERNIIYAVTGRQINSTKLPADAGCIVDNVSTIIAIYRAVCLSTPLMERVFTVTGDGVNEPCNFRVPVGMMVNEIAEEAGGLKDNVRKLISGGPMMGMAMAYLEVPVVKTSSALTCFTKDQVELLEETPCIRCGRCVQVCPSNIVPTMMLEAARRQDMPEFVRLNGMECMECGSCTFACPARRPLTQAFKQMRQAVMAERRKQKS